ncbi:L,D-transpeptidase family protein [Caniella muris]|uniref:L,D-transpeptidase family protein n=1 Tax=Caniella muris TaxID=2941502 RepID=UPI00203F29F8|nr:L,D-transpeptidase family protein [Caniella muris]
MANHPSGAKAPKLPRGARTALVVVGAVAVVYLAGVALFSNVFMPNTRILGRNVSLRTVGDVQSGLSDRTDAYTLQVTGENLDLTVKASEIGLSFDAAAYVRDAISETHPWLWPVEVFLPHDLTHARGSSYDHDKAAAIVAAAVEEANTHGTDPVDATIAYNGSSTSFEVTAEKPGTKIDVARAQATVEAALDTLERTVKLPDGDYVQAKVTKDEPGLARAAEAANSFLKAKLTLSLDGKEAGVIDASKIIDWVTLDDNLEATLDEQAIKEWGSGELSRSLDTVGTERSYTRPDGKAVTVVGGTYGWNVDSGSLADLIVQGVKEGKVETVDIPTHQTAETLPDASGRDWGASYVDVDLAEQHARYYDANGSLVWEADIVSGDESKSYQTPTGVYFIDDYFNKSNPGSTLIGKKDPETGKPEYETPVSYWMPFVGNSIGLHDADWRSSFGGTIYRSNGSHGCVNLPPDKAAELCSLIDRGTVVVVHG